MARNRGFLLIAGVVFTLVAFGVMMQPKQTVAYSTKLPLLVSNRDQLEVCVAVVGDGRMLPKARTQVEEMLTQMSGREPWTVGPLAGLRIHVDSGCTQKPRLLVAGQGHLNSPSGNRDLTKVTVPSKYRAMIYVVTDEPGKNLVKSLPTRTDAQELLCSGHTCQQVTSGLYLSSEELDDGPFLEDQLAKALGLKPAHPYVNIGTPPPKN